MSFRIRIDNTQQTITCAPGTTLLAAAVEAGIEMPYGCASGNCGLCMCKLHAGSVDLLSHSDGALRPEQEARGMTLACRAVPRTDVQVQWLTNPKFD